MYCLIKWIMMGGIPTIIVSAAFLKFKLTKLSLQMIGLVLLSFITGPIAGIIASIVGTVALFVTLDEKGLFTKWNKQLSEFGDKHNGND